MADVVGLGKPEDAYIPNFSLEDSRSWSRPTSGDYITPSTYRRDHEELASATPRLKPQVSDCACTTLSQRQRIYERDGDSGQTVQTRQLKAL